MMSFTKTYRVEFSDNSELIKTFPDLAKANKFALAYMKKHPGVALATRVTYSEDKSKKPATKTRNVKIVSTNPTKRPKVLYSVWTAARDGIKHERIAIFDKLNEAKKYAQSYADSSGVQMIIETKKL